MHPAMFAEAAELADALGYESLWIPEHLVLPVRMAGSPFAGAEHPPIPPTTPVFDVFAYLAFLAGRTQRIRLGTHVYNLALRHPFVAARAVSTVDVVSEGRLELGVGAGWLREEWDVTGLDFDSRGARLDEALAICVALWTEERVARRGRFYTFDEVAFEPKPVQRPHPPVLIGGESPLALRRAARHDGWIGLDHTPDSLRAPVDMLRRLRQESAQTERPFSVTVGGRVASRADIDAFALAGVDRLIVRPWERTREVVDGLRRFADLYLD